MVLLEKVEEEIGMRNRGFVVSCPQVFYLGTLASGATYPDMDLQ